MVARRERTILTYDDLQQFPNDGNRYELIDGELYVSPAPSTRHQRVVTRLTVRVGNHVERLQLGEVFVAPLDVKFSPTDTVEPDLIFISNERLAILGDKYVTAAPDLVIEVFSPTTAGYDRGEKRDLYARYDVPNLWFFDPRLRTASASVLEEGRYREVVLARDEETFSAPPFADLIIALGELWD